MRGVRKNKPIRDKPIRVKVHEKGDRRLDGILRLIEEAGRPRPIGDVLATLCAEIAAIARTDVASVYVREEGELVMRGNVGLAAGAVGNVRLRVGEGITGFVAECLRPVSCAVARTQAQYKHVPGIGEEHFPSFLALPLLGAGGAAGVMVLQRREAREWQPNEVALAMALAAPVAYALERARDRAAERTGIGALPSRAARLDGVAVTGGVALGRAESLPALDAAGTVADPGTAVGAAITQVARELDRARRRLEPVLDGEALRRLRALALLLEDRRLSELAIAEATRSGVARGLERVAREYARAPYRMGAGDDDGGAWLSERAAEVEDLCALIAARATDQKFLNAGAVVIAERLTAVLALAATARRCAAFALGASVDPTSLGAALLHAAGIPVVAEVASLFVWTRPGDRVLVDGTAGCVRVNPPATTVARLRASERRG